MIQQIIRGGLLCAVALCLGGCGDADGPRVANPGLNEEYWDRTDPHWVSVPTIVTAPELNPVLEFPRERIWQMYYIELENPWRDRGEARLMDAWVNPSAGQAIADIGAGGGYYTFRYASRVGAAGFVHAVDHDWRVARKMAWETKTHATHNVLVTQVPTGQLGLEEGRFDTVLMVGTGILFNCDRQARQGYLDQIVRALRPGGQFIYVDTLNTDHFSAGMMCPESSGPGAVELAAEHFVIEEQVDMNEMNGPGSFAIRFRLRAGH